MNDLNFLHSSLIENSEIECFETEISSKNNTSIDPNENFKILILEDDQSFGNIVKKYLEKFFNLDIKCFYQPNSLIDFLDNNQDFKFCLLTDISLGEGFSDGLFLIDLLKDKKIDFFTVVMTGFGSIDTAISATKKGAYQYLTKPFELKHLQEILTKGFSEHFQVNTEILANKIARDNQKPFYNSKNINLKAPVESDIYCNMIGRSSTMKIVFDRIKKVSNSTSTILITGNSGTGKELVAKALHNLSSRKDFPIIAVNCGAIPSELLESELFGHVKGSFTGAVSDRKGRFELANNGTIFLDEIGDMPHLLQVKLLRVLQNREIERVGDDKTIPVNIRIIAATHRNLEKEVTNGNFREDLFYRLNVIPIALPRLSERKEDIPILIAHFLKKFISADGRNSIVFSDKVIEVLMSYNWPGNVRELENLIERLIILKGNEDKINLDDLPSKILSHLPKLNNNKIHDIILPAEGLNLKLFINSIESSMISQALQLTDGNKNQASKLLNMNRTTLIEKLKKTNSNSFKSITE